MCALNECHHIGHYGQDNNLHFGELLMVSLKKNLIWIDAHINIYTVIGHIVSEKLS